MGKHKFTILAVLGVLAAVALSTFFFTSRIDPGYAPGLGNVPPARTIPPVIKKAPPTNEGATLDVIRTGDAQGEVPTIGVAIPDVLDSFTIGYGDSENQLGIIEDAESPQGPTSFSVDAGGNWYIADSVKGRIAVFSPQGIFARSLLAQGSIDDVTVTDSGLVYVLDAADKVVRKYDPTGAYVGRSGVDAMLGNPTALRSFQEKAYVFSDRQYQSEIKIDNSIGKIFPAALGASDAAKKRYVVEVNDGTATLLAVDRSGSPPKRLDLDVPRVASASFLRENKKGHLFVQVERFLPDYQVGLSILRLTPKGAVLAYRDVPNNVYTWTAKMVEVDEDGDLFQAIPTKKGVRFRLW